MTGPTIGSRTSEASAEIAGSVCRGCGEGMGTVRQCTGRVAPSSATVRRCCAELGCSIEHGYFAVCFRRASQYHLMSAVDCISNDDRCSRRHRIYRDAQGRRSEAGGTKRIYVHCREFVYSVRQRAGGVAPGSAAICSHVPICVAPS